jgi:hypothetical protein
MKKIIAFACNNNGVLINTVIIRSYIKIIVKKDYASFLMHNLFCFINSLLFINNQNKYAV